MDDKVITDCTAGPAGEPVVLEPQAEVRFLEVFHDVSRRAVSGRERRLEDMTTESLGGHWFRAMTPIILTVVVSTAVRVVTMASPLLRITAGMSAGVEGVARVTVATEMLLHQNRDVWPAIMWRLVD